MTTRVLIMAGGTGGHVFPALAVADELRSRGVEVTWLGTQRGLESDVVPKAGITIDWITISGLRGNGLLGWLQAPARMAKAMYQAWKIFRLRKPHAVLGMGGFVTGPGGLVAWLTGKPLLVHEQNSIPGMTNKMLTRVATKIMVAFPGVFAGKKNVFDAGNPLRANITNLPAPEERFASRDGATRLLVVGGSLGAAALNEVVPQVLARIPEAERPVVWHQTGKRNFDEAKTHYEKAAVKGDVVAFIDDMAAAYAWADLVICRAGALTVSELAAVGVGSILVPYPFAVDDHQTTNARYLVDANAAICVQQRDLTVEKLSGILMPLLGDRSRLLEMAKAARKVARPNATRDVADMCLEVARV